MKYEQNENRLDQVHKPRWCPMMAVTLTLTPMEQVLETPVISQSTTFPSCMSVFTTAESSSHIRYPSVWSGDISMLAACPVHPALLV
jgi:hypothetical protein